MFNFKEIEQKWQRRWAEKRIFEAAELRGRKFYCLEMFPYPSGEGLHMGHTRNYAIGDVIARFKRMRGFNVLYPMGYDAFGLPAENAAIKRGIDPKEWTMRNIELMKSQQTRLGFSYDWNRMLATCLPDYYHWNQWIFLQFLKRGLAYKKKSEVNWCPSCKTVLANEQVKDGRCWRCKSEIEPKVLEQWFLKITDYAERLLEGLEQLDWPEQVITMQRNWIGRSEGVEIDFGLDGSDEKIRIFTTRPDTLFGVTFVVFAPEHPMVLELVKGTKYEQPVKEFIERVKRLGIAMRTEAKIKEGLFIGRHAVNPVNGERVPIYVANFVLPDYGTGAIMAVPAHDQRDFLFAKKFGIPIKIVIQPEEAELKAEEMEQAYVGEGILVNSGQFDGMRSSEAIERIADFLEEKGFGRRSVCYKLKDWLISRQRYWGTPIPVVYCDKCGIVGVPESELPVKLPEGIKFSSKGNPLEHVEDFVKTKCPKCGSQARRETDTMDTFFDSSWYFLRYCSPGYKDGPFDPNKVSYWMPVDFYVGGIEHATGHLIYARFFTKALADIGLLNFDEPFKKLLCQGMVTLGGVAMSKSRGNVVDPIDVVQKYGADTTRLFILFAALPEKELEWSEKGIEGCYRFLQKVWELFSAIERKEGNEGLKDELILSRLNATIRDVTQAIEKLRLNRAIVCLMNFVDCLSAYVGRISKDVLKDSLRALCLLLAPFVPHIAEECWERLGYEPFVSTATWPEWDESKIKGELDYLEDMLANVRSDIMTASRLTGIKPKKIKLIVAQTWKYRVADIVIEELKRTHDIGKVTMAVMKTELRHYGKDAVSLVRRYVKDQTKLPRIVLDQDKELSFLEQNKSELESEFGAPIVLERAQASKEPRARNALPGKPAIVLLKE